MRTSPLGLAVIVLLAGCSSDESTDATTSATVTLTDPTPQPSSQSSSQPSTTPPLTLVVDLPEISGDGPPRPEELDPPTGPTVCLLLSTDEVADVFGVELTGSEEGNEIDDEVGCIFLDADGQPFVRLSRTGPGHSPSPAEVLTEMQALDDAVVRSDVADGGVVTDAGVAALFGDRLLELRPLQDEVADADAQFGLLELAASRL